MKNVADEKLRSSEEEKPEGGQQCSGKLLTVYPSKLYGEVTISGAKNSALRLLAASILTADELTLENYPSSLLDTQIHVEMLEQLGKRCLIERDRIVIREEGCLSSVLAWNKRTIRNTLLILGALVARTGKGAVPHPGGCAIGASGGGRSHDLHVMLLRRFGAIVNDDGKTLSAEAPNGIIGCDIELPIRSTGATENSILVATLAEGKTRIWNPHVRPEILDLIACLRSAGADIQVYGQERIEIKGVSRLHGTTHRVIPDNIEALTWLIAAVLTRGEVEIHDFPFEHLEIPLIYLRESGARLFRGESSLVVRGGNCFPLELSTGPYPGINSDMQPLLAVYGANANGESRFIDLRFPGRYGYAEELKKMGLDYDIRDNVLYIYGGNRLRSATVRALDLRAGAALALAGLNAEGPVHIQDPWQIERGYSSFDAKMRALGAKISWSS